MAVRLAAVFLFLLFCVASAVDFHVPAVFNFGDSNSDTGDLIAAGIGDPLLPPNGQTYFSRPAGRFSDGRLIIDFLSNFSFTPLDSRVAVITLLRAFDNIVLSLLGREYKHM